MDNAPRPLRILHVMRAPVGGLFRHVADLSRAQAELGHEVGIVADSETGASRAEEILKGLAPVLALGIFRSPMSRHIGLGDWSAVRQIRKLIAQHRVHVVHGHGAKGGAYVRLVPDGQAVRVYTPHGGSLHYSRRSPLGLIYLTLEQVLMRRTELFLFESAYGRHAFEQRVGTPSSRVRVVYNGVSEPEFAPITPEPDRTDLLFVGELRMLKGIDTLLEAIALLKERGTPVTATIVGEGPDAGRFRDLAASKALGAEVRFVGALPARSAFGKGEILVVPSRAESLPYIVLEAAAAGVPIIATKVGGIPEIFGGDAGYLVPPGDAEALANAVQSRMTQTDLTTLLSRRLQDRVRERFSLGAMTSGVLAAYSEVRAT